MQSLLVLNYIGNQAVTEVTDVLKQAGLRVIVSFDTQLIRSAEDPLTCPHHGTAVCDCQIVILLVYDSDRRPATLLAHGQDGETWFSLAVSPGQRSSLHLENKIRQALSSSPL